MIDLMTPTRGAIYRALANGAAAQLAPVFTEAPQGTKPNFFEIGSINSVNMSAKPGDQREELTVEIWAMYRGEARGDLLAMMHAARSDLDRQPLDAPGVHLRPPRLVLAHGSDADADGITYGGLLQFTIEAQPA